MRELTERSGEPPLGVAPAACPVVKLPEAMPRVRVLDGRYVLVRSEYWEAERAALVANPINIDSFLVAGPPGIGTPPTLSSTEPSSLSRDFDPPDLAPYEAAWAWAARGVT